MEKATRRIILYDQENNSAVWAIIKVFNGQKPFSNVESTLTSRFSNIRMILEQRGPNNNLILGNRFFKDVLRITKSPPQYWNNLRWIRLGGILVWGLGVRGSLWEEREAWVWQLTLKTHTSSKTNDRCVSWFCWRCVSWEKIGSYIDANNMLSATHSKCRCTSTLSIIDLSLRQNDTHHFYALMADNDLHSLHELTRWKKLWEAPHFCDFMWWWWWWCVFTSTGHQQLLEVPFRTMVLFLNNIINIIFLLY